MHTLTLNFADTPTRDRFIVLCHSLGIHGKSKSQPGTFRYRVVAECPDAKTHKALTEAWGKITTERR